MEEEKRFIKFQKQLETHLMAIFIIFCVLLSAGVAGMISYGVFIQIDGPIVIRNQYIGLWLSTLLMFFSAQGIYLTIKNNKNILNNTFFIEMAYFSACNLLSLVMTICYGISKKIDATILSFVLIIIYSLSIYVLVIRRKCGSLSTSNFTESTKYDRKRNLVRWIVRIIQIVNVFIKILFSLFVTLLAVGSIIIGGLSIAYPPRGKFTTVPLSDESGRSLTLHFLCDGPVNSSYPTFMFEGSNSHGLMDFYGIQIILKENNRRSCIWDKAGLGYSDNLYIDMLDHQLYYHNFLKSINEKPPFIFIGHGTGGSIVFNYALQHPEMVSSITFLDVSPGYSELMTQKILKNWTNTEYEEEVKSDLSNRYGLFGIINGLGVPLGLMPFFFPKNKVYPRETANEVDWYFLTGKFINFFHTAYVRNNMI
jgi:pimeloyl-ACP methyl ester carboxylesterase